MNTNKAHLKEHLLLILNNYFWQWRRCWLQWQDLYLMYSDFEVWLHTSENAGFFFSFFFFSCQWVWTNLSILYLLCKANRRMRELGGNEAHCAVSNLCFCNTNRNREKETQAFLCYLGVACHSNNTATHWMYQNNKSVDCAIVVYFHFRNESHGAVVS